VSLLALSRWQFAVLVSASFFVTVIGAWYLVKGRALPFARRSVSIGLGIAATVLPLQIFLGDHLAPPPPACWWPSACGCHRRYSSWPCTTCPRTQTSWAPGPGYH